MYQNFIPFYGWVTLSCMDIQYLVWPVVLFYLLAIIKSPAVNIGVSVWVPVLNSFKCLRVELLGHTVILGITFWGSANCFTQWLHQCLHSFSNAQGFQFFPHPCQHLWFFAFFIMAIIVGIKRYFIMVLICLFLMTDNTVHPFTYFVYLL